MPGPTFVLIAWAIIAFLAIGTIGSSLILGYRQKGDLVTWRKRKLYSAVLGVVGLALLLVNFDQSVRAMTLGTAREHAVLVYIDIKAIILEKLAELCGEIGSENRKLTCFDLRMANQSIIHPRLRDGQPYDLMTNWQKNSELEEFYKQLNRDLEYLNSFIKDPKMHDSVISNEGRLKLSILAAILIIIAVAGSVGEAAFQLRQAIDNRSNP